MNRAGSVDGKRWVILAILGFLMMLTGILSCSLGDMDIHLGKVASSVLGIAKDSDSIEVQVVRNIRLPRTLSALAVGASLAICGVVMQAVFRNPLADPGLIGVSAGGAVGAITFIVFGTLIIPETWEWLHRGGLMLFPMIGGGLTTWLVYRISRINGRTNVAIMLLAGLAMNSLMGAIVGYAVFLSDDNQLREFTFWSLGTLAHSNWEILSVLGPVMLFLLFFLSFFRRELNLLLLGENEAMHLGVNVEGTRRKLVFTSAAVVGLTVAYCGMIGFVGLVTPHLCRLILGPDHRFLIPASALMGGAVLGLADLFSRLIIPYSELPVGVLTATIGAPFFLFLIVRSKDRMGF